MVARPLPGRRHRRPVLPGVALAVSRKPLVLFKPCPGCRAQVRAFADACPFCERDLRAQPTTEGKGVLDVQRPSVHGIRCAHDDNRGAGDSGIRVDPAGVQPRQSPTVSVLIPAHNESGVLRECLDSLKAQTATVDQIVVVADSCTDDTAAVAESYGATVVIASAGGKAGAQDAGLPHVRGEIMVCVDADTILAPDVVELLVRELETVDATCANMLPMPSQRGFWVSNRRFAYALGRYWWRWCQNQVGRLMVLSGCANAMRTEIVREMGGFPGDLITCDMDLTWNLYKRGYRTSFCHRAIAYTYDPETYRVYTMQMQRWASGFYQNFQTHWAQVLKSPRSLLVVGSLLLDLLTLPLAYGFAVRTAIHDPGKGRWFVVAVAVHAAISIVIASRTIGWKAAIKCWPCYFAVNWLNKAIYLWTFFREWVLGMHYASWTGRQGRRMVITPMPRSRIYIFGGLWATSLAAIVVAAAVSHWQ